MTRPLVLLSLALACICSHDLASALPDTATSSTLLISRANEVLVSPFVQPIVAYAVYFATIGSASKIDIKSLNDDWELVF